MLNDWQLYALGSAFFAGLTAIFAKVGVIGLPSNTATLFRTIIILIFLVALVSIRREWVNPSTLNIKSVIFLALSAFATGFSWICYFRALQSGPASIVSVIDKLSLLVAVILSVVFFKESLNFSQWIGVLLMGAGALLVVIK